MASNQPQFKSKTQLLRFAEHFLKDHLKRLDKDIRICLREDPTTTKHAYFPALITGLAFLEFLSGLYHGKVRKITDTAIRDYADTFLDRNVYDDDVLQVLREVFRHKVAHLAHPYYVTPLDLKLGRSSPKRVRLGWLVTEKMRKRPVTIEELPQDKPVQAGISPPWKVTYDHQVIVSIPRLKADIAASVNGYRKKLAKFPQRQDNLVACLKEFFPPD